MLSSIAVCPMSSFIVILIVIAILLDYYSIIVFGLAPKNKIIIVFAFLIALLYAIFTVWIANKTCYNFIWISWLIVIYLVFYIINGISIIIDPKKQDELRKEYELMDKKIDKKMDEINNQTAK